jgi:hypothetical protein
MELTENDLELQIEPLPIDAQHHIWLDKDSFEF